MAQEIYHRSNWGIASNEWGSTYLNADLTNELYKRAGYYENSWATDKILNKIGTKPSIIMTPTAYKDGKLNSVKPAQVIGEELVTNGDFSDGGTDWINTDGSAIFENGYVKIQSQGSTLNRIRQIDVTQVGKTFKLSYEIIENNNVSEFKYYNGTGYVTTTSTVGTHTVYFVAGNNNDLFFNVADANTDDYIIIDNVSLKEVINADFDFTRGSSATRVNEKGLIEITDDTDLPRINYTNFDYENGEVVPYSGEGSLLLEPQSTNLVPYSEDFSQWALGSGTSVESGYLAPDGSNNACKVTGTIGSSSLYLSSVTSSTDTRTIYARTVSGTGTVNLCSYGQNTNNNFTITEQWQRFEVNGSPNTSGQTNFYGVDFRFEGLNPLNEVIIWGAQAEALSYATSYIPTNGTTVTRLADVANNAGNADLINSTEGVLYAEISALADDVTNRHITLSDGTDTNRLVLKYDNQSNVIQAFNRVSGVETAFLTASVTDITLFSKCALKFKLNDYALWIDGFEVDTDTNSTTFPSSTLNDLKFSATNSEFYGNVKSLAVFKEALSDEELQKLTTI